jgi:hypothetical protein
VVAFFVTHERFNAMPGCDPMPQVTPVLRPVQQAKGAPAAVQYCFMPMSAGLIEEPK